NLQAAHLFECYLDRLDEADQLDGLKHLAHVYVSMHKWHKVDELAKEMLQLATLRYNLQRQSDRREDNERKTEKPLYFYILYAQLIRSNVFEKIGDYPSALDWVSLYMDGSWIQEDNEEAKRTVAQFQEWGTANRLLYRVMAGQYGALSEYVEYISERPDEIFIALHNIISSANRYDWNVDYILERFASYIPYRTYSTEFGDYNRQVMLDQHTQFLAEMAAYYLHNKREEGIRFILQSLESSARINDESNILKCVDLFEQHRHLADEEEKGQYKLLIREVQDSHEKKIVQASSFL
ncbi:transcriptional regulator, partial [Paenibacillus sp. FSL H8-0259]